MSDLLLKISARDLARVAPFVAAQDVRYYLNGVNIEPHPEGAILTATNGHILAAMLSRESFARAPSILAFGQRFASEVRKAANSRKVSDPRVELRDAQSFPEVVTGGGTGLGSPAREIQFVNPARPALLGGKFPDWRKVLPDPEHMTEGLPGCVKSDYLQLAVEAALGSALAAKYAYHGIMFQHDKRTPGESAIIIRSTDARDLILVVMPMRGEEMQALPAWTLPPPPPPVATPAEPEKAAA